MTDQSEIDRLRAINRELVRACKFIINIEHKSILAACAYQGPPPKKWIKENAPYYDGYNKALNEIKQLLIAAIARAAGGEG
jgi:hypothetical protein